MMRMAELKILTYNVQGLGGISKRTDIFDFLKKLNFDIYCLQETHFTDTVLEQDTLLPESTG